MTFPFKTNAKLLGLADQVRLRNGMGTLDADTQQKVINWAQDAVINYGLLENVLNGDVVVCGWIGREPILRLTEQGIETAKELMRNAP